MKSFGPAAAIALIAGALASAPALAGPTTCLPAGPGSNGLSTGWNKGVYKAFRFVQHRTTATRVIVEITNGAVIFDGAPTPGTVVNFAQGHPSYRWPGFKSGNGTHMNGICVELLK